MCVIFETQAILAIYNKEGKRGTDARLAGTIYYRKFSCPPAKGELNLDFYGVSGKQSKKERWLQISTDGSKHGANLVSST